MKMAVLYRVCASSIVVSSVRERQVKILLYVIYREKMQEELKIIVVGPPSSGKTEICNLVAAVKKQFQGDCKPTIGVRILEYSNTVNSSAYQTTLAVQLWDVSGDEKYMQTWPAIANNADGICFIYNAHDKNQGRLIENYVRKFGKDAELSQCMVIAHKIGECDGKPTRPKLPRNFENVKVIMADIKSNPDPFIDSFGDWLGRIHEIKMRNIEDAERQMIGEKVSHHSKNEEPDVEELNVDD